MSVHVRVLYISLLKNVDTVAECTLNHGWALWKPGTAIVSVIPLVPIIDAKYRTMHILEPQGRFK